MESLGFGRGTTSTITITAKDGDGNAVAGYVFKFKADIFSDVATTAEEYTINGTAYTTSTTNIELPATDASGVTSFDVVNPSAIDPKDGIQLRVFFNNGPFN